MVVPIPTVPVKKEGVVDVAMSDPTVSCDVVAINVVPAASETMIEFGAKTEAFVPPLTTGRTPLTCDVREICPPRFAIERQLEEIAKQPLVILNPTLEVEVARAEMFNPRRVVVPALEISRAEMDDVACDKLDEVEM